MTTDKELIEGLARKICRVTEGGEENWKIYVFQAQAALAYLQQHVKPMVEALRKSLIENDTGDKHNDYDGLYFDVEQALANLPPMLKS